MTILRTDKIAGLESVNAITGSVFFDGASIIVVGDSDDFHYGTGDFTVEGWIYATGRDQQMMLIGQWDGNAGASGTVAWALQLTNDTNGYLRFLVSANTSGVSFDQTASSGSVFDNEWHHIAVTRNGNDYNFFLDGTVVKSFTDSAAIGNATVPLTIGGSSRAYTGGTAPNQMFTGYFSNIRLCKGKALYTAAFTPPTRQLEVTSETVLLCCQSSGDMFKEEIGKTLDVNGTNTNNSGPLPSTFTPDVGNDHTHGTVLEGNVEFPSLNYMTLPRGTTSQRANSRGRAVIPGGYNPTNSPVASRSLNTIEYIEINTTGHAKDFGDLSYGSASGGTCSSSTRAVTGGSYVAPSITGSLNTMSYFTIATLGDGTNFGDLTVARGYVSSLSSDTRGIWAGGAGGPSSPYIQSDVSVTDYVTIASEGVDASDFGELIDQGYMGDVACSSPTRGVIAGGNPTTNVIQYVTIASIGVAKDFGDLTAANAAPGAASSHTRAVFCGSSPGAPAYTPVNTIDYVTIASTGNASDFGDSLYAGYYKTGTSNCIRAVWTGTYQTPAKLNTIEYAQIQTLGNTVDFGDSTMTYSNRAGATSDTHGGLA